VVELYGLVLQSASSSYVSMKLCFSAIRGLRVGSEKDRADVRGDHSNSLGTMLSEQLVHARSADGRSSQMEHALSIEEADSM